MKPTKIADVQSLVREHFVEDLRKVYEHRFANVGYDCDLTRVMGTDRRLGNQLIGVYLTELLDLYDQVISLVGEHHV